MQICITHNYKDIENENDGISLYKQLSELWEKAGMHAHKWMSNSKAILQEIPFEDRACKLELSEDNWFVAKTLGVVRLEFLEVYSKRVKW